MQRLPPPLSPSSFSLPTKSPTEKVSPFTLRLPLCFLFSAGTLPPETAAPPPNKCRGASSAAYSLRLSSSRVGVSRSAVAPTPPASTGRAAAGAGAASGFRRALLPPSSLSSAAGLWSLTRSFPAPLAMASVELSGAPPSLDHRQTAPRILS